MEMSSVHCLKNFVNERLTAAAEEIFRVFEKTLFVYQEEIVRQRRLLDIVLKPEIKLQRSDHPQPSVGNEGALDQQQCEQEKNTCLDHAEQELQIKQEQEEVGTSYEEEQFDMHKDTEAFKLSPAYEGINHSEEKILLLDPDQNQSAAEQGPQSNYSDERMQYESERNTCLVTDLNRDQAFRTGEKQYMCGICGESFKMNTDLKVHLKIHTGEKPFRCMYCEKEFAFSSSLSRHLRVHTGEKPYECSLCGKRFNVSTTLKVHYRIHTGEKPYKCKTCEKAFTTCSNLKKHMSQHNKEGRSSVYRQSY